MCRKPVLARYSLQRACTALILITRPCSRALAQSENKRCPSSITRLANGLREKKLSVLASPSMPPLGVYPMLGLPARRRCPVATRGVLNPASTGMSVSGDILLLKIGAAPSTLVGQGETICTLTTVEGSVLFITSDPVSRADSHATTTFHLRIACQIQRSLSRGHLAPLKAGGRADSRGRMVLLVVIVTFIENSRMQRSFGMLNRCTPSQNRVLRCLLA